MNRLLAVAAVVLLLGCAEGQGDRQEQPEPARQAEARTETEPHEQTEPVHETLDEASGQASDPDPQASQAGAETEMKTPESPTNIAEELYTTTDSGLMYYDLVTGAGESPEVGRMVTVHYAGWLTDGTRFDNSYDRGQPFSFPLGMGRVIRGWDEGVQGMKEGGRRQLVIPPHLGYGDSGAGGVIPPGATLIFEVEFLGAK